MELTRILDILDRAESGPQCTEREWNLKLLPKIFREKAKEYKITYSRENLVNNDNSLADDAYQAGFEAAVEAGVLCLSTEKRILFSDDELHQILREVPKEVTIGFGNERVVVKKRKIEDKHPPLTYLGPLGHPISQDLYVAIHQSVAKLDVTDSMVPGTLQDVHGRKGKSGTPYEAIMTKTENMMLRQACKLAGREGLAISPASSLTAYGYLAASNPEFGFYPTDIHCIPLLSELKTNWDMLSMVVHSLSYGGRIMAYMDPIYGGYFGGPEPSALAVIATAILGTAAHAQVIPNDCVLDIRYNSSSSRETIWANTTSHQALARNTDLLDCGSTMCSAGPGTEFILYEVAAGTIGDVVSGSVLPCGVSAAKGRHVNHCSGLENRLMGELCREVPRMGLKREEANEIIKRLLKKYEKDLDKSPIGMPFDQIYNLKTLEPTKEWFDKYNIVTNYLGELGIILS